MKTITMPLKDYEQELSAIKIQTKNQTQLTMLLAFKNFLQTGKTNGELNFSNEPFEVFNTEHFEEWLANSNWQCKTAKDEKK